MMFSELSRHSAISFFKKRKSIDLAMIYMKIVSPVRKNSTWPQLLATLPKKQKSRRMAQSWKKMKKFIKFKDQGHGLYILHVCCLTLALKAPRRPSSSGAVHVVSLMNLRKKKSKNWPRRPQPLPQPSPKLTPCFQPFPTTSWLGRSVKS